MIVAAWVQILTRAWTRELLHPILVTTVAAVACSGTPSRALAPIATGIWMETWARPLDLEVRPIVAQSASSTAAILTASQIKALASHHKNHSGRSQVALDGGRHQEPRPQLGEMAEVSERFCLRGELLRRPRMIIWSRPCVMEASLTAAAGTLLRTSVLWISGMVAWTRRCRSDPRHVVATREPGWICKMTSSLRRPWPRSLGSQAEPTSGTQTPDLSRSAALVVARITACLAEGSQAPGLRRITTCSLRDGLLRTAGSQNCGAQKTTADQ